MGISYENIIGVIRAGKKHKKFGDEFEFSVVVVAHNDIALLKCAVGKLNRNDLRLLIEKLKELNFKTAIWERIRKDGTAKQMKIDLNEIR